MGETVTVTTKDLKKQKETVEKLLSVFGKEDYNEWLFKQHQNFIIENSEKAFDQLFELREKFSSTKQNEITQENKNY